MHIKMDRGEVLAKIGERVVRMGLIDDLEDGYDAGIERVKAIG